MSSSGADATKTTREEDVLAFEIYFWIVRQMNEKGVVKLSELRKLYQTVVTRDKSVQIRPLQEVLNLVNDNLLHWQGWRPVMHDDRISYVDLNSKRSYNIEKASETERTLGLLENVLMYVFVATKPNSKHPGVSHEELMSYLESSLSTHPDHKLAQAEIDMLKKQIAPNVRADFIRKGYLSFAKTSENDEEVFRYEWGATSRQCIDPVHLVQLFQKLTGMTTVQLKEQYERAKKLKSEQFEAVKAGVVLPTRGKKNDD